MPFILLFYFYLNILLFRWHGKKITTFRKKDKPWDNVFWGRQKYFGVIYPLAQCRSWRVVIYFKSFRIFFLLGLVTVNFSTRVPQAFLHLSISHVTSSDDEIVWIRVCIHEMKSTLSTIVTIILSFIGGTIKPLLVDGFHAWPYDYFRKPLKAKFHLWIICFSIIKVLRIAIVKHKIS